jgi:hypothetical protein
MPFSFYDLLLTTLFILYLLFRLFSNKSDVLSSAHLIRKEKFKKGYKSIPFFSGLGVFQLMKEMVLRLFSHLSAVSFTKTLKTL